MIRSTLTLSTLCAGALLLGVPQVQAADGHDHGKKGGHAHSHGGPGHSHGDGHADHPTGTGAVMSSHDGMTALYRHLGEMETEIAAGKLDGIHGHSEALAVAVRDLDKDTALTAAKKKRVGGYARNVLKLSDKLHHSADGGNLEQARKDFAKLKAQVDLLDRQFAHSHKPGKAGKPGKAEAAGKAKAEKAHSHHEEK